MNKEMITVCIKHTDLEVKELSELLYIISLSINQYYRENGIAVRKHNCYAPTVQAVRQGSIEMDLALAVIENIAVGVAAELIAEALKGIVYRMRDKYESGKTKKQIFTYEITTRIRISIEPGGIVVDVKRRAHTAGSDE